MELDATIRSQVIETLERFNIPYYRGNGTARRPLAVATVSRL